MLYSAGGTLHGTPLVSGIFSFTVQVTDNDGDKAQETLTLIIEDSSASDPFIRILSISLGKSS